MYVQLTWNSGNDVYNSNVSILSDDVVKAKLAKMTEDDYIEDKGICYWGDDDCDGIFIPLTDDLIKTIVSLKD